MFLSTTWFPFKKKAFDIFNNNRKVSVLPMIKSLQILKGKHFKHVF